MALFVRFDNVFFHNEPPSRTCSASSATQFPSPSFPHTMRSVLGLPVPDLALRGWLNASEMWSMTTFRGATSSRSVSGVKLALGRQTQIKDVYGVGEVGVAVVEAKEELPIFSCCAFTKFYDLKKATKSTDCSSLLHSLPSPSPPLSLALSASRS